MLRKPKLSRELSLPYYFMNDKTQIDVPLCFRLKFDEVIFELKKRNDPDVNYFEYLLVSSSC